MAKKKLKSKTPAAPQKRRGRKTIHQGTAEAFGGKQFPIGQTPPLLKGTNLYPSSQPAVAVTQNSPVQNNNFVTGVEVTASVEPVAKGVHATADQIRVGLVGYRPQQVNEDMINLAISKTLADQEQTKLAPDLGTLTKNAKTWLNAIITVAELSEVEVSEHVTEADKLTAAYNIELVERQRGNRFKREDKSEIYIKFAEGVSRVRRNPFKN